MESLQQLALFTMLKKVSTYKWTLYEDTLYPFTFGTVAFTVEEARQKMISVFKKIEKMCIEINKHSNTLYDQYSILADANNKLCMVNKELGLFEEKKQDYDIVDLENKIKNMEDVLPLHELGKQYRDCLDILDQFVTTVDKIDRQEFMDTVYYYKKKLNGIYLELQKAVPKDKIKGNITEGQLVDSYIYTNVDLSLFESTLKSFKATLLDRKKNLEILEKEQIVIEEKIIEARNKVIIETEKLNIILEEGSKVTNSLTNLCESLGINDTNIIDKYLNITLTSVFETQIGTVSLETFIMTEEPEISKLNTLIL